MLYFRQLGTNKMPEVDQSKEVKVEKVEEVQVEADCKTEGPDEEWIDVLGSGDLKKKVNSPKSYGQTLAF